MRVLRGLGPMTTTNLLYSMRLDYPEAVVRKALQYLEGNKRITRDSQKQAWKLVEGRGLCQCDPPPRVVLTSCPPQCPKCRRFIRE